MSSEKPLYWAQASRQLNGRLLRRISQQRTYDIKHRGCAVAPIRHVHKYNTVVLNYVIIQERSMFIDIYLYKLVCLQL